MQDIANFELPAPRRIPWNKGKLTGAKPPLRQKHVWAIRTVVNLFKVFDAKQDLNTGDDIMRVLTHIRDLADNGVAGTRKSPCFLHLSASFCIFRSLE